MTMHYNDTVTAKEIWDGWLYHGRGMPFCYSIATKGDSIAYNVWEYLRCFENGTAVLLEEFWKGHPSSMIEITKDVISMYMHDKVVSGDPCK